MVARTDNEIHAKYNRVVDLFSLHLVFVVYLRIREEHSRQHTHTHTLTEIDSIYNNRRNKIILHWTALLH